MTTPDPRFARYAATVREIREAAEREASAAHEGFGEPDAADVYAMTQMMFALFLDDERRATFREGQTGNPGFSGLAALRVMGYHLPGHVEEGRPVVYVADPRVPRALPPDALPVALLVPLGREGDARLTYPDFAI